MVTTDRPKREKERISSIFGMVAIVISMGNVIKRSTSCAASVGDDVITCT